MYTYEPVYGCMCEANSKKFSFQEGNMATALNSPANFGPLVVYNKETYGDRSRNGLEKCETTLDTSETVAVILTFNHVLDLTYPSSYGQLLAVYQELILCEKVDFSNLSATKCLENLL